MEEKCERLHRHGRRPISDQSSFCLTRGLALLSAKIKVYLQVNKETKDPGLQDIIRKSKRGTHTNIAEAIIDTTKPSEKKVEDIDDLEKGYSDDDEK